MKKNIYIVALLSVFQLTCTEKQDDFSGREWIRGRLSYQDIYSGDGSLKPLGKKMVKLAYSPSDTLNYLYNDSTDADGYFIFKNAIKGLPYDLIFEDSIGGNRYLAFKTVVAPDTTVNLIAKNDTIRQNGLYIETKLNGQPAGAVRICIFNNEVSFNVDTCNGNFKSDFTDAFGKKIYYNIAPGNYYVRGFKRVGTDMYLAVATQTLSRFGIPRVSLNLEKVTAVNGLTVEALDEGGLPVVGATVGIYRSRTVFNLDTLIQHSLPPLTTNNNGKVDFPDLVPAKYYIRARLELADTILAGLDSMPVNASGFAIKPVTIK